MFRNRFSPQVLVQPTSTQGLIFLMLALNLVFNIVGNASFKMSTTTENVRGFLAWQVVGNSAGLITVLTLTAMLRFVPLSIAYPLTTGLAVIGVQIIAAAALFHEAISPVQWLGTLCIALGIVLIGGK
jgi:multidrug transporter EmrE-like cation transporter